MLGAMGAAAAGRGAAPAGPPPAKGIGKGAPPGPPPAPAAGQGAAPAKGAGKGPPPPPAKGAGKGAPPPPPAKGAGKGPPPAGKGVGKGFGVPPAPPAVPPAPPAGKGKGKSRGLPAAPPEELVAPASAATLRPNRALRSAEGTLWEGLDLWGTTGEGVLAGTVIDVARLQQLWGPMPEPPAPAVRPERHIGLPPRLLQQVEIAVRAQRLEAGRLRRALTEDLSLISEEQAQALYNVILPSIAEAQPHLQIAVRERGAENLSNAEGVLWMLSGVPLLEPRVRLAHEQYRMDDDTRYARHCVDAAQGVVNMLKKSRPVRTVLQTVLVVRNIMSQIGDPGFATSSLDRLLLERLPRQRMTQVDPVTGEPVPIDMNWLREQNPTMLTLTAEMLESTHEHRCRLRFLRMFVLGRRIKADEPCRIIWSFLDDLHESPRDAMPLLAECTSSLCNAELVEELSMQAMYYRQLVTRELPGLQNHPGTDPTSLFSRQLDQLGVRLADALQAHDDGCAAISDVAADLCRLGGETVRRGATESFKCAATVLQSLRVLGQRLGQEMAEVHLRRRQMAATADLVGAGRSATRRRHWAPVDTRGHTVVTTSDPDIIRQLRWCLRLADEDGNVGPGQTPAGQPGDASEGGGQGGEEARAKEERAREEREAALRRASDLFHGGAEGVYRRDPITGRWGPRLDGVDGTGGEALNLGGPSVAA